MCTQESRERVVQTTMRLTHTTIQPLPLPQRTNRRSQRRRKSTASIESTDTIYFTYVVIGGGVAGTEAAKKLIALSSSCPSNTVALITPSFISDTLDKETLTPHCQHFGILLKNVDSFSAEYPQCTIISEYVVSIDHAAQYVTLSSGQIVSYGKLCIATGASPKLLAVHPLVKGIRDRHSAAIFETAINKSRRICVVGNGAIALETVGCLLRQQKCQLLWVSKQTNSTHVGSSFFDPGAGEFLCAMNLMNLEHNNFSPDSFCSLSTSTGTTCNHELPQLEHSGLEWVYVSTESKLDYQNNHRYDCGLGPTFKQYLHKQQQKTSSSSTSMVREYGTTIHAISNPIQRNDNTEFAYVWLTCGNIYACDLIISAIGVVPNLAFIHLNKYFTNRIDKDDGGLIVNAQDLCVAPNIYAAGDCTTITSKQEHWFQMRLWSQARAQGHHAAMVMSDTADMHSLFHYDEIFVHHTTFWGWKVFLIGKFNQVSIEDVQVQEEKVLPSVLSGSDTNKVNVDTITMGDGDQADIVQVLVRRSENEFCKLVLKENRLIAAVLVGNDMENAETFENLILNGTDVSGIDLLNAQVDLADYFD